jgi:uncharacterized protein
MNRSLMGLTALALSTSSLLSGCGKMGELQPPAPRNQVAEARAAAASHPSTASNAANKPSRAGSVAENVDPATSEASIRQVRLPGSSADPFGGPVASGFPSSGPR